MCVEISNNTIAATMEYNNNTQKKMSYSLKKVLKTIFKKQRDQQKKKEILKESLESLENLQNAEAEIQSENEANERIYAASSCGSSISSEDQYDEAAIYVPVHFARTEHGTFFWTASSFTNADADLIEPLYCGTDNQIAVPQFQSRWAQA